MLRFRGTVWPCAVVLLALGASPLGAAWDNVFQVCCHNCGHQPVVSAYAPPACCPQPQCCTTNYQARCYYEPVTTYQTKTYYEPVTSYRTSYYYEPVAGYRTSYYYDPCSCSYKQTCTQVTNYQLRSQCCPVQSWVQRCATVAVQSYRQSFYWEPVTTCSPPPPCPPPCPSDGVPGGPSISERRSSPPPPALNEYRDPGTGGTSFSRYPPGTLQPQPVPEPAYRQIVPQKPQPANPPAPSVKLDRIVALPADNVEGQVVLADNTAKTGAELLFVADRGNETRKARTDGKGEFRLSLASGTWLIYVQGADGKPVYHSKLEVRDQARPFTLVSR